MHIEGLDFVIVAAALFLGAIVQGSLGFGMILMAFPAIVLVEPELLPQTTLIVALPMIAYVAVRSRGAADVGEIGWIMAGRLPGFAIGVTILALISQRALALLAGSVVLAAVALSFWAPTVPRNRWTLAAAGTVSAVFGITVSIGGPPIALLYQRENGPRMRSTMSLLVVFGAPVSLTILALSGQVDSADLRTGFALMPCSLLGSYTSRWIIPWFDQRLRPVVLTVCAVGAIIAMLRVALVA